MGLFGKLFGGGGNPPPGAPSPSHGGRGAKGAEFKPEHAAIGPYPKRMRLCAIEPGYNLVGSWQEVVLASAEDYEPVRAQVMGAYYKQYGMYRLPDGSQTIRWNEETWRDIRQQLEIHYDPAYQG